MTKAELGHERGRSGGDVTDASWSSVAMPTASQSVKTSFVIALAIGLVISFIFAYLDPYTNFYFLNWQIPGATAAFIVWGMLGGSTFAGLVIGWFVNGLVYSLFLLAVIRGVVALMGKTTE